MNIPTYLAFVVFGKLSSINGFEKSLPVAVCLGLAILSCRLDMKKQKPRRKQRKEAEVSNDELEDKDNVPTPSSDPLPSEAKANQAKEFAALKKKVSKLNKWGKSRSRGIKILKRFGLGRRVKSPMEKDSLGAQEDASKQGRMIEEIDQNAEIALDDETQGRINDDEMFGVDDLDGEEVVMETTTEMSTTIPAATTIVTTAIPTPRAKGIVFHEQKQSQILVVSSSKDKGKAKMIEPEVPLKKKDQMRSDLCLDDAEGTACLINEVIFEGLLRMGTTMASAIICLADNQKFNFLKVDDLAREEVVMDSAAKPVTTIKDSTAPTTDVTEDEITMAQALAALKSVKPKVMVQEQKMSTTIPAAATKVTTAVPSPSAKGFKQEKGKEFFEVQKARLLVEQIKKRKKHFAALRAQEKRSKPPTKTQMKSQIEMRKVNDFVAMDSEAQKSSAKEAQECSTKRTPKHLEYGISKKQKVDKNVESVINDTECWVILCINPLYLTTISFGVDAAEESQGKHAK
nr:hypothetical protein [Tanacetum cinerariifolium]